MDDIGITLPEAARSAAYDPVTGTVEPPAKRKVGRPKLTPEELVVRRTASKWSSWTYRCYAMRALRIDEHTVGWIASNVFPMLALDTPHRFVWGAETDRQE